VALNLHGRGAPMIPFRAAAAVPSMARKTHSAPRPLTAASPTPCRNRARRGALPASTDRRPPPSATAETTQRGSSHCNEMTIFRTRGEHFAVKWPRYTKKAQVGFIAIPQIRPRNSDNRYFVPKRLLFERANRRRARLRCDRLTPPRRASSSLPQRSPPRRGCPLSSWRNSVGCGELLRRVGGSGGGRADPWYFVVPKHRLSGGFS